MKQRKIGEPLERWPLTLAAKLDADTNRVAAVIFGIPSVVDWVEQGADHDLCDRRACSLVTMATGALRNASQPFVTPAAHRNQYIELASRLERGLTGKRRAKLLRDLHGDKASALHPPYKSDDLTLLAPIARVFAEACDNPNWVAARPKHDQAPRNDFVQALTDWQRNFTGSASHVLTADITCALFTGQSDQVDRAAVERLTRLKRPTPAE